MTVNGKAARSLLVVAVAALVTVGIGCSLLLRPAKPSAEQAVPAYVSLFPFIERLHIERYDESEECTRLEYARGRFAQSLSGAGCLPVSDRRAFTDEALRDLRDFQGAIAQTGVPLVGAIVTLTSEGRIAGKSAFVASGCMTFFYEPGWSRQLEESDDLVETGIDSNWRQTDFCPGG
jgi:hypothetical protein